MTNAPNSESHTSFYFDIIERQLDFFVKHIPISLFIISATGLLIRLYYFPYDIPITLDGLLYFWYAVDTSALGHLPTGHTFANNGWPVFLSIFFTIFHSNNFMDYMFLQRLVSISISILTIIPIYLLCNKFFEKPYSLVGGALFVFEPRIIQNSLLGITEPLYIFLIANTLFLFLNTNKKLVYASFGILALASLVRSEALFLFPVMSVMFFVRYRSECKVILSYIIAAATFILLLIPMAITRIQTSGNDALTGRITNEATNIFSSISNNNSGSNVFLYWITGLENPIKFLGWSLIPVFIFLVPLGAFLIFKNRNYNATTVIITILVMLVPAFYALSQISDTRYLFPLYPLFCILFILATKYIGSRFRRNIFLTLLVGGILLSSATFLDFKKTDIEHEKEALSVTYYVINQTKVINQYLPESKYIAIIGLTDLEKFPILSSDFRTPTKILYLKANSLESYINLGKNDGLTHLVLDDNENIYRPDFFKNVFYNEIDYPYLIKEFDSHEHGYKYHLKIYKIDYEKFESVSNGS